MEYRYLLVVRFTLLNVVAIAALFAGYMEGWLDSLLEGPTFFMTFSIFTIFVHGSIGCATKIWRTSEELNDLKTGMPCLNPVRGSISVSYNTMMVRGARSSRRWCA